MRQSDLNSLDIKQSIVPMFKGAGLTGDINNGAGIDRQNAESALLEVNIGNIAHASSTVDVVWQESDDNVTFTDIAEADLLGGLIPQATEVLGKNTVQKRAYIGMKRYLRCKVTVTTGAATGEAVFSANVVLGHLRQSV
jgi:hypothetical protein